MNWDQKASDWQVCAASSVAGGAGLGGGYFVFAFYSATAGGAAWVRFAGFGLGVGGNASGVVNPADYGSLSSPWSTMCNVWLCCGVRDFSINDLNGAVGRVTQLGGGAYVVGYAATFITAAPLTDAGNEYFWSQSCSGLGYGMGTDVGMSGVVLKGGWAYLAECPLRP